MIYFTSDLHFNHANIIMLCNRPFQSVEEMNRVLIENWNNAVNKNDDVYVLGDFIMGKNIESHMTLDISFVCIFYALSYFIYGKIAGTGSEAEHFTSEIYGISTIIHGYPEFFQISRRSKQF